VNVEPIACGFNPANRYPKKARSSIFHVEFLGAVDLWCDLAF